MTPTLTLDDDLGPLVDAFRSGRPTIIPTDTVYGLATGAHQPEGCERLARLKGRDPAQPTALVCGDVDTIFTTVLPELLGRAGTRVRRLLPGPVTLIVPNPAKRFRWLAGATPDRIGVRVPDLDPRLAAAIDRVGAIAATSANPTGHPPPRRLSEVDAALLDRTALAIDGGEVGGLASTVIDLTGADLVILREGPMTAEEVERRLEGT
jgi:L-threonylcarbamoyladenylate synthase